jgi:hypothetical protein
MSVVSGGGRVRGNAGTPSPTTPRSCARLGGTARPRRLNVRRKPAPIPARADDRLLPPPWLMPTIATRARSISGAHRGARAPHRYEKGAIVLTSNKHVRDWPEILPSRKSRGRGAQKHVSPDCANPGVPFHRDTHRPPRRPVRGPQAAAARAGRAELAGGVAGAEGTSGSTGAAGEPMCSSPGTSTRLSMGSGSSASGSERRGAERRSAGGKGR